MLQRGLKRVLDILVSGTALLLLSPVLVAVCLAIRLSMGSPVFFHQRRTGQHGRLFTAHKLRTMADTRDSSGALLPDSARMTAVGTFVRRASLDELPQLWNILTGDMSLVGPRPLLPQYLPLYSPEQRRRHLVPAGLTGWAQIHGRNAITWERRFDLDVWYVDHWSLLLDLRILALTALRVVSGSGAQGNFTMPEFTGSPERQR